MGEHGSKMGACSSSLVDGGSSNDSHTHNGDSGSDAPSLHNEATRHRRKPSGDSRKNAATSHEDGHKSTHSTEASRKTAPTKPTNPLASSSREDSNNVDDMQYFFGLNGSNITALDIALDSQLGSGTEVRPLPPSAAPPISRRPPRQTVVRFSAEEESPTPQQQPRLSQGAGGGGRGAEQMYHPPGATPSWDNSRPAPLKAQDIGRPLYDRNRRASASSKQSASSAATAQLSQTGVDAEQSGVDMFGLDSFLFAPEVVKAKETQPQERSKSERRPASRGSRSQTASPSASEVSVGRSSKRSSSADDTDHERSSMSDVSVGSTALMPGAGAGAAATADVPPPARTTSPSSFPFPRESGLKMDSIIGFNIAEFLPSFDTGDSVTLGAPAMTVKKPAAVPPPAPQAPKYDYDMSLFPSDVYSTVSSGLFNMDFFTGLTPKKSAGAGAENGQVRAHTANGLRLRIDSPSKPDAPPGEDNLHDALENMDVPSTSTPLFRFTEQHAFSEEEEKLARSRQHLVAARANSPLPKAEERPITAPIKRETSGRGKEWYPASMEEVQQVTAALPRAAPAATAAPTVTSQHAAEEKTRFPSVPAPPTVSTTTAAAAATATAAPLAASSTNRSACGQSEVSRSPPSVEDTQTRQRTPPLAAGKAVRAMASQIDASEAHARSAERWPEKQPTFSSAQPTFSSAPHGSSRQLSSVTAQAPPTSKVLPVIPDKKESSKPKPTSTSAHGSSKFPARKARGRSKTPTHTPPVVEVIVPASPNTSPKPVTLSLRRLRTSSPDTVVFLNSTKKEDGASKTITVTQQRPSATKPSPAPPEDSRKTPLRRASPGIHTLVAPTSVHSSSESARPPPSLVREGSATSVLTRGRHKSRNSRRVSFVDHD